MRKAIFPIVGVLAALAGLGLVPLPSGVLAVSPPVEQDDAEDGYEVLTRGPVHEAFAESVNFEPEPGIVVATAPPDPIEELPPEVQPEGDNVEWIPGYWGWEDDRDDYLWISGVWRDLPPGRQWVPGYWNTLATGEWQWVSGYWADESVEEVTYISTAPPETIEVGPSVAAPSRDHSWIPGVWIHASTRYVWRPGYWSPLRSGWTWVPARYCWTPRGYVFVDGYWDHAVDRRGVLFAPVHFRRDVWHRPGYHYRPSIVVALEVFTDHLFYRPRTSHYYFGDYYEPRYRAAGYNAAYAWHSRRGCYDPIYAYQRWHHRDDRGWESRLRDRYEYRRSHADARPPRTWSAMRQLASAQDARSREPERVFASTLGSFRRRQAESQNLSFRELGEDRMRQIVERRQETLKFSRLRQNLENRPQAKGGPTGKERVEALKERMASSPIASRPTGRLDKSRRPPERLEPNASRLRQDALERMKKAGTARTSPGRERAGSPGGNAAAERMEALRKKQQELARERAGRPTGRGNGNAESLREAQQQRLREAQEKARAAQQSRQEQMDRIRQQQPDRSRGSAREVQERAREQQQERLREAQEKARQQQQERARQVQERSRQQQQERARESQERIREQQQERARAAQEKARQQQQERARAAQERARQQQQERARQIQERARQQQQERARQQQQERARQNQDRARQQQQERARAAQQQQERLRQARDRARQQQQERGRGGGNPRSRGR